MSRRSGFTLIEIIVVVSITMLLSVMILVYSNSSREMLRLLTEKARMAQLVARAKSLSLSTYTDGNVTRCGYGVRFDKAQQTYSLISYTPTAALCANPTRVDTGGDFTPMANSDFTLPTTLEYGSATENADDVAYLIFIPPDPVVLVAREDGSLINGDGRVALKVKGSASETSLIINGSGQVTY